MVNSRLSSDEVTRIRQAYDDHARAEEQLDAFLRPVAEALKYDGHEATVTNFNVHVIFQWHGPYQAEDQRNVVIPLELLIGGQEAVITHCRKVLAKENEDALVRRQEEMELRERQQYAELKAKYDAAIQVGDRLINPQRP